MNTAKVGVEGMMLFEQPFTKVRQCHGLPFSLDHGVWYLAGPL